VPSFHFPYVLKEKFYLSLLNSVSDRDKQIERLKRSPYKSPFKSPHSPHRSRSRGTPKSPFKSPHKSRGTPSLHERKQGSKINYTNNHKQMLNLFQMRIFVGVRRHHSMSCPILDLPPAAAHPFRYFCCPKIEANSRLLQQLVGHTTKINPTPGAGPFDLFGTPQPTQRGKIPRMALDQSFALNTSTSAFGLGQQEQHGAHGSRKYF
jgi:hypothetical protein